MKINEPKTVATIYKISDISKHFDLGESQIIKILNELIEEESILAHDIRKTEDGEYLLSQYCLVSLITTIEVSEKSMLRLDEFLQLSDDLSPAGEYVARMRLALYKALMELDYYKGKDDRQGVKGGIEIHFPEQCSTH